MDLTDTLQIRLLTQQTVLSHCFAMLLEQKGMHEDAVQPLTDAMLDFIRQDVANREQFADRSESEVEAILAVCEIEMASISTLSARIARAMREVGEGR